MNKKHLYILTAALAIIGAGVLAYRAFVLEFPLTPRETTETWRVEARVAFEGRDAPARLELMLPKSVPGLTVFDQSFVTSGYGLATASPGANRMALFSKKQADGTQVLYYRAVVHRAKTRIQPPAAPEPELQRSGLTGAELAAGQAIVKDVDALSADTDTFVRLLVERLTEVRPGREESMLLGRDPSSRKIADVAVRLLGLGNIPARQVNGLSLFPDRRNARFDSWIEVYDEDRWRPFDPKTGTFARPADHLPWWRGRDDIAKVNGGRRLEVDVAVQRTFEYTLRAALTATRENVDPLSSFSVFGLPIQTQEVYRMLLVVPAGIFLLVILRNVVGLKTFGTFMPVLIALAFRQTELMWGLIMFGVVLAIGLAVRFYLEQLKLLLVPRLACVVMVVIVIMAALSVLSHKLGFDRGLSVALFPIVILAMTIERMSIVWDERGAKEALQQASGSVGVAIVCYLLMNVTYVQHLFFIFPETVLLLLAATLLLGRYSGYRLVELPRFKVLAGDRS
jgi:hypothetical protein